MTDYIKREDAITELRKRVHRFTVADEIGYTGTVKWSEEVIYETSAMNGLMSVPAADVVERKQWIPVTEQLPNCNGCYLVWRPHFFGGEVGMPSICYFDGSNTWHDSYGVDFERILHPEDITHWMPLPQPPKEET